MDVELVAIEFIGLVWALISAICMQVSVCHSLRYPARQPLSSTLPSFMKSMAHIQSLWAAFRDCLKDQKEHNSLCMLIWECSQF